MFIILTISCLPGLLVLLNVEKIDLMVRLALACLADAVNKPRSMEQLSNF